MNRSPGNDADDDEPGEEAPGGEDENEGAELQDGVTVTCPYCGEKVEIVLDAGGGDEQEYVEDCEVCCRPWRVIVQYDEHGTPEVWLEESS